MSRQATERSWRSSATGLMIATLMAISIPTGAPAADSPGLRRSPPAYPARMIAEWEPANGTLIRWPLGFPMALAVELAEDDTLYTLVEGASNENQARSAFTSAGVNMDHVRFIRTQTYSMWTRDWGPQCVFGADGQMGIADPWFDGYPWVPGCASRGGPQDRGRTDASMVSQAGGRTDASAVSQAGGRTAIGRDEARHPADGFERSTVGGDRRGYEEDDAINADVAIALGLPLHELPAYCTGGNIMTDGHGRAFSTEQMLAENAPHMSAGTFFDRAEDYLGITDYQILPNPEVYGIQHIDCYAKLLDEETVLVKEVPAWHPEYDCCEDLVAHFQALTTCYGRPYEIVRIDCTPYYGDEVAAYTNSLILNGKVLVPTFGIAADADAIQTYQDAMPGYEVIGVYYGSWYYYDALHCRTMGIFDPGMLRVTHAPLDALVPAGADHEVAAVVEPMSGAGLVPGAQLVRWRRAGETAWNDVLLSPARVDTLAGAIPGQTPGDIIEYYVTASDSSGRTETLPSTAPAGFYSFQVDPASAAQPLPEEFGLALTARPSPCEGLATLSFTLDAPNHVRVAVYDVAGRLLATLIDAQLVAGPHETTWDGITTSGVPAASGVYFVRLSRGGSGATAKLVLVR